MNMGTWRITRRVTSHTRESTSTKSNAHHSRIKSSNNDIIRPDVKTRKQRQNHSSAGQLCIETSIVTQSCFSVQRSAVPFHSHVKRAMCMAVQAKSNDDAFFRDQSAEANRKGPHPSHPRVTRAGRSRSGVSDSPHSSPMHFQVVSPHRVPRVSNSLHTFP
jgi:hypothetical protein